MTMYGAFSNVEKENAWEASGRSSIKTSRARQHALFFFDDEGMAERARLSWFPGEDRLLIEAHLIETPSSTVPISRWLNCQPPQWEVSAGRYWRGEMSDDPLPEIVVDGAVYFPGWKEKPFGLFAGLLPEG